MKQEKQPMITSPVADDAQFGKAFRRWNRFWLVFSIISVSIAPFYVLPTIHTIFQRILIIILSLGIIVVQFAATELRYIYIDKVAHNAQWPPPRFFAWSLWLASFIMVAILTRFNIYFGWDFYTTFGLTFALFEAPLLFLHVIIIFIIFSFTTGLLAPPFDWSNVGALVGIGFSFIGSAGISAMIQYLISERYERNRLLRELTASHAELEDAHHQLAESAVQEQELAVLRERTRFAREMHDTLGHALVLLSVKLEAAQRLRNRDSERCGRELEEMKEIVRSSMHELRISIANLRSPTLEKEPAYRALCRQAREISRRTGWHVTYELGSDIEGLPEEVEEILWKVGQEALVNIEKHAQAENVTLHIQCVDGNVILRILDDGCGIPQALCESMTSPKNHYGINGMVERVANLNGKLTLQPAPERGTLVEVCLPLIEKPLLI
jgi:signal transduction histidine kinase